MSEEEKWIEEARNYWGELSPYISIGFGFDLYLKGYLQACKVRQEEIEGLKGICAHCGLAISHGRRVGDIITSACPVFAKKEAK